MKEARPRWEYESVGARGDTGAIELISGGVKDSAAIAAGTVSREDRERLLGQKGVVAWLTGLSGSGKSTLARKAEWALFAGGRLVRRIDGDEVRGGLNAGLGFSMEDRRENVRRIAEAARLFAQTGVAVLVSVISPTNAIREMARKIVGKDDFLEVHVSCPLEVCEARDPKGLYRRARSGELPGFTGIDSAWEAPVSPSLEIRTDLLGEAEAARRLAEAIEDRIGIAGGRARS
jgi:adenylylsulfate kinase